MRTATIRISHELLFNLLGLNGMNAKINCCEVFDKDIELGIIGEDDRIPDKPNYPDCHVVCRTTESHLEEIK